MKLASSNNHASSAIALHNIDKALRKLDVDADLELDALGYKPSDFWDEHLLIPLQRCAEILQHCINVSGCEHFILVLVQEQTSAINGYFGMLLRTAPTLGDALRIAVREMNLHHKGLTWALERGGGYVHIQLGSDTRYLASDQRRLLAEIGMAQGWFVMREQTARAVSLASVNFIRDAPADDRPYRRFFNASVQFNTDVDQLNITADQLRVPMSHADSYLHAAIRELINTGKANIISPRLEDEVCTLIRRLLPQGECSIENVSRYLMREKRTLQRQLREEFDVTYNELVQEERLKLAQMYLLESQKSILQIAYATGYKDPSNMTRAFRKRFGCTPRQWREQHPMGPRRLMLPVSRESRPG